MYNSKTKVKQYPIVLLYYFFKSNFDVTFLKVTLEIFQIKNFFYIFIKIAF